MDEIKVGDVVRLKSGSVNMTVSALNAINGIATCVWDESIIPERSIFQEKDFPVATLEKISAS